MFAHQGPILFDLTRIGRARIVVIAGAYMLAAEDRITAVVRAGVGVIAVEGCPSCAASI
jgi:hypothetical protein